MNDVTVTGLNVIVDTGCANVSSVKFAIERLGFAVEISRDPEVIKQAKRVVLPGVGTAENAMRQLNERGLVKTLQQLTQPVLGICLGMQMQTNQSVENQGQEPTPCLGMVDSEVLPLDPQGQRLPHMGWNTLQLEQSGKTSPLLKGINDGDYVYFVHSFAVPVGTHTLASCEYGQRFSAVIQQDNFYGCQFHPERSASVGAQILKNFMELEV